MPSVFFCGNPLPWLHRQPLPSGIGAPLGLPCFSMRARLYPCAGPPHNRRWSTLGGARTVDSAFFAVHLKLSVIDRMRSFGLRQHSKLWQISAPCPHWHVGREIRNRILCFKRLDGVPSTQRRLRRFLFNNQPGGPRRKSHVPLNLGPKQGAEE